MTDWLGPDLAAEVTWEATDAPLPDSDLTRLAAGQWDINKFLHYLPVYEKVFSQFQEPVRLLEIGANLGGSLELWRSYFGHREDVIVGIDNNRRCAQLDDPANNIHVRIGVQQDRDFLARVVDELGPFDVVIDDGSHIPSFTLASFQYLFPRLNDGGAYIVEDLFSYYTPECREPFLHIPEANDGSPTFIEFIKQLIDVMHVVYLQTPDGYQVADAFEPGNRKRRASFQVPLATTIITGIEIYDSIVVIHKGQREVPRIIRRWSAERLASIVKWNAEKLFRKYPHLGHADRTRRDWMNG